MYHLGELSRASFVSFVQFNKAAPNSALVTPPAEKDICGVCGVCERTEPHLNSTEAGKAQRKKKSDDHQVYTTNSIVTILALRQRPQEGRSAFDAQEM
jgi:hypothetical protein